MDHLRDLLRCPSCHSRIERVPEGARCLGDGCRYADEPFPVAGDQPVLIDFGRSIFQRDDYAAIQATTTPAGGRSMRSRIRGSLARLLTGTNETAPIFAARLLEHAKASSVAPIILVVGGRTVGSGAEGLYEDPSVLIIGSDVLPSRHTVVVADGHALPFKDEAFDGVWIQAVLEHVLEPQVVADEIHRVLKPGGYVYADTPFMQQVHGGAYDFTRFTLSGHRWLFRRFEQNSAGTVAGAGIALLWSIQYFVRALGSTKAGVLLAAPFFWVRFLGRLATGRPNADAASSIYFYGSKSGTSLRPQDMPGYYEQALR